MPTAHWRRKKGLRNSPVISSRIGVHHRAGRRHPFGSLAHDLRGDRRNFGARLGHGNAFAQSADDHHRPGERAPCAASQTRPARRGRAVSVMPLFGMRYAGGRTPTIRTLRPSSCTDEPTSGFGAAECRTPERIADQRHVVLALQSLVRKKGAPAKSLNARDIEQVRSHFVGKEGNRPVEGGKSAIGVGEGSHALEASAAVAPIEEEGGCGQSAAVASLAAEVRPDDGETRGVAEGKRIQQHPVDETEDCCGRADTQRDDQDREQVEPRIAAEQTQTIEEVSEKGHIEMDAQLKQTYRPRSALQR